MKTLRDEEIMDIPVSFVPTVRSVQLATFYWRNLLDMFSDCVGNILAKWVFEAYKFPYGYILPFVKVNRTFLKIEKVVDYDHKYPLKM